MLCWDAVSPSVKGKFAISADFAREGREEALAEFTRDSPEKQAQVSPRRNGLRMWDTTF